VSVANGGERDLKGNSKMTCKEIAERIFAHLKRFEADPKINKRRRYRGRSIETTPYYKPYAFGTTKVGVVYIIYQGATMLSKSEALAYLEWLDAGHVGTHYELKQSKQ